MHYPVVIPRSMVRIRPVRVTHVAGWPSGLRRQFKALVSSEARVRISLQSFLDTPPLQNKGGGSLLTNRTNSDALAEWLRRSPAK